MFQPQRHSWAPVLGAADALIAGAALFAAYLIRVHVLVRISEVWRGAPSLWPSYAVLLIATLPIMLLALYVSGAYDYSRFRSLMASAWAIVRALALSAVGVMAFAYVLRDHTFSRAIVALYLLLSAAGFFTARVAVRAILARRLRRGVGLQNALIVGTGPAAREIRDTLASRPHLGYRVLGLVDMPDERHRDPTVPTVGTVDELPALVDREVVDAVIFATSLEETSRHEKLIWKLEEVGKTVHMRGDAVGVLLSRTFIGEFQGIPILSLRSTPADPLALAAKRAIDVIGSGLGMIVLAPVFALTALAVKLTSPGPVLYRQERVGLNGRRFRMLKFRSMYVDADKRLAELRDRNEMTGPVFKMKHDPRVTPVGRFIRKFSIDELPQLWNVFVGEMSLVGPRPPIPHEVEGYERWQRRRLSMKPGLTCLWQVSGRNDVDFDTWMKLDMEYIDNWSLLLDLKILVKTIPVVLTARGAH
ncbi:MAG: sugar transferase [Acidobacteriota bacterium]